MPSAYLWCPAYPLVDAAHLAVARAAAERLAGTLGLRLVESPLMRRLGRPGQWWPVEERLADLDHALGHDVLIAARGGYGCIDLVEPLLAYAGRGGRLVGYSDLTVLHACWRVRGWAESLYGFCPAVSPGARAHDSTAALLRGAGLEITAGAVPLAHSLRAGDSSGIAFAACLRVLAGLAGTPAMPDLAGCILALEDVDERPYQIDRDLTQLHLAGALSGVAGLVFGRFPSTAGPGYAGPDASTVCARWAERLAVPAVFGLPIGHDPDPITIPCGRPARLRCQDGDWTLTFAAAGT